MGQFTFVAVSDPSKPPSTETRKLAYSHAVRQAHARKRRLRTEAYQSQLVNVQQIEPEKSIALPSPRIQELATYKDPFSALARPLSKVEYYLLNQYVNVIIPWNMGHCGVFNGPGDHVAQLREQWVGLAVTDDILMIAAVLLSTCRYFLQMQPHDTVLAQMALQYKQACIHSLLRETGSKVGSTVTATTVAKALALAVDDVTTGEHEIARQHCIGILALVASSGNVESVGLTGVVGKIYWKFMAAYGFTPPDGKHGCVEAAVPP